MFQDAILPLIVFAVFYLYKRRVETTLPEPPSANTTYWKNYSRRYLIIFVVAVIISIVYQLQMRGVSEGVLMRVQFADLALPILGVVYYHFIILGRNLEERLELALVSGLGYAVGSALHFGSIYRGIL